MKRITLTLLASALTATSAYAISSPAELAAAIEDASPIYKAGFKVSDEARALSKRAENGIDASNLSDEKKEEIKGHVHQAILTADAISQNRDLIRANNGLINRNSEEINRLDWDIHDMYQYNEAFAKEVADKFADVDSQNEFLLQEVDKIAENTDKLAANRAKFEKETNAGIASSIAIASLPAPHAPGQHHVAFGTGYYGKEGAIALGATGTGQSGIASYKIGVSYSEEGGAAGGIGGSIRWK